MQLALALLTAKGKDKSECEGELHCLGVCCNMKCMENLPCPAGTCPVQENVGKEVNLDKYEDTCCTPPTAPCCDQPIASCLACKVCMQPAEFCAEVKAASAGGRRLLERRLKGQHGSGKKG